MKLLQNKLVQIILVAALSIIIYLVASKAWMKLQYFKSLEKDIIELKEVIKEHDDNEIKIIDEGQNNTKKAAKKNKSINNKLKEDEKTIDNSNVSDDQLDDFLSGYED